LFKFLISEISLTSQTEISHGLQRLVGILSKVKIVKQKIINCKNCKKLQF
jgi:hypothetical protein